ncbi:MAG: FixH family protein [Mesorhizobium sp.]
MTRQTRIISIVAALAVIAIAAYFIMLHMMTPPADLDLSRERATTNGIYRVTVAPEKEPFDRAVLHSWIATVTTPDGAPVEGAEIKIDGGMPQHGHGLPTAPEVTADLGQGRYRIEGVRFNMGGWWEFKLAITAVPGSDDVTFNLSL